MIGRLLTRAKPPTLTPSAPTWPGPWPWGTDAPDVLPVASESEALDLAVVSGFLGVTTSLLAQMPLQAVVGSEVVEPTPRVLQNPIPGPNRVLHDFITEYVRDAALYGNYVAVLSDPSPSGWPDQLYGVPWGQWTIDTDGSYLIGGTRYAARDIFHVALRRRTGERHGRGLMQTHGRLLAATIAAERWSEAYYLGGASPPMVLAHPNAELTQEQAADLKVKLRAATRRREPVIVPQGTSLATLNSDADSAQLSESRKWNAHQLANALGIPGALLGLDSGASLVYRNLTDLFAQFVQVTIMGYIAPLEAQMTSQLLPLSMVARFNTSAVLRPDYAARVDLATKGLAGGVYSEDEARELVDLPPTEEPAGSPPQLSVVPQEAAP